MTDKKTLIACETHAAIAIHLRYLTETGPHYGGNADSMTLCGMKPSWDLKCHPGDATCLKCLRLDNEK